MYNQQQMYLFGQIQTSQTGGQLYGDTSLMPQLSIIKNEQKGSILETKMTRRSFTFFKFVNNSIPPSINIHIIAYGQTDREWAFIEIGLFATFCIHLYGQPFCNLVFIGREKTHSIYQVQVLTDASLFLTLSERVHTLACTHSLPVTETFSALQVELELFQIINLIFSFRIGQSWPLFVYFRPFLITISSIQIEKRVDGVLGIRTQGQRMVGGNKTT